MSTGLGGDAVRLPTLPGMTQFSVIAPDVHRVAMTAETAAAQLFAEVRRLRVEAQDVLAGRWLGGAADRFDRAWSQWDADARAVLRSLDELTEALRLAARDYAVGDAVAAEQLRLAW